MWESPEKLWRRLKLGREEYLQRLITTLIVGGDPPAWNTPQQVSDRGGQFLQLLDALAHDPGPEHAPDEPGSFIDEYLLPKLDEDSQNGWPDWAVLWKERVWIIELKTEAASHRADQLPYYLRLAAAAHPTARLDVTYITGSLAKRAPPLLPGQRFSHLTWARVLPLIVATWASDPRPEVAAYVGMTRTIIENLDALRPAEQRLAVLGETSQSPTVTMKPSQPAVRAPRLTSVASANESREGDDLLALAHSTAADGRQRGVGATNPTELETLRDVARTRIGELPNDDPIRFVLPWLWRRVETGGAALTPLGDEFGYELRFSRYKSIQVKP